MANHMKEVANLLGVELHEEFNVKKCCRGNPYRFTESGLYNRDGYLRHDMLYYLISGSLELEKAILDQEEKEYLESVLRPFKNKVRYITKVVINNTKEFISIELNNEANINFPYFKEGTIYQGMENDKKYTIEELRLFEED